MNTCPICGGPTREPEPEGILAVQREDAGYSFVRGVSEGYCRLIGAGENAQPVCIHAHLLPPDGVFPKDASGRPIIPEAKVAPPVAAFGEALRTTRFAR